MDKVQYTLERYENAKSIRNPYESTYNDIGRYIMPYRAEFNSTTSPGTRRDFTFDDTAKHSLQLLAASYVTGLMNTGTRWMEFTISDDKLNQDREVKDYLQKLSDITLEVFASNSLGFPSKSHELVLEYLGYGTGVMLVEKHKGRLKFNTFHLSKIHINEDSAGNVDTVFRAYEFTLKQAVQEFGEESLAPKFKQLIKEKKWDTKINFLHAVFPRAEAELGSNNPQKMPFASLHIDLDNKHLTKESGYYEFPYIVPRFSKIAGELYGYSPSWVAMSTIKSTNALMSDIRIATSRRARPPLAVNDECVVLPINTAPDSLNFVDYGDGRNPPIQQLPVAGDMRDAYTLLEESRRQIKELFYVDQLSLPDLDRATTAEVQTRNQDRFRLLGPQFTRFQAEALQPLVDRVFNILMRSGAYPEVPEILSDVDIEIEYRGPMLKLLKAAENESILRTVTALGNLSQVFPTVMDPINPEALGEVLADNNGTTRKIFYTEDQKEAIRAAKEEQRQQQEMMQQGLELTEGVKNLGQAGVLDQGENI